MVGDFKRTKTNRKLQQLQLSFVGLHKRKNMKGSNAIQKACLCWKILLNFYAVRFYTFFITFVWVFYLLQILKHKNYPSFGSIDAVFPQNMDEF